MLVKLDLQFPVYIHHRLPASVRVWRSPPLTHCVTHRAHLTVRCLRVITHRSSIHSPADDLLLSTLNVCHQPHLSELFRAWRKSFTSRRRENTLCWVRTCWNNRIRSNMNLCQTWCNLLCVNTSHPTLLNTQNKANVHRLISTFLLCFTQIID